MRQMPIPSNTDSGNGESNSNSANFRQAQGIERAALALCGHAEHGGNAPQEGVLQSKLAVVVRSEKVGQRNGFQPARHVASLHAKEIKHEHLVFLALEERPQGVCCRNPTGGEEMGWERIGTTCSGCRATHTSRRQSTGPRTPAHTS